MRDTVRDESAQGVIEFAIIMSILMLLFLGVVDFSRFMYYDQAVRSASRVGAEVASNHCVAPGGSLCGFGTATNDFVIQSAVCDGGSALNLKPYLEGASGTTNFTTDCTPCSGDSCGSTPVSTCDSTCAAYNCTQDVCVQRSETTITSGDSVKVSVGYNFQPITPLMSVFFQTQSCWSANAGDSTAADPTTNGHTLCATSTGSVS